MTFRAGEGNPVWHDGTRPAPDLPWKDGVPKRTVTPLVARINREGRLSLAPDIYLKSSLCGNYGGFRQMQGTTAHGQQPNNLTTTVHSASGLTYLGCIALCGKDINCRAAAFDTHYLTCRTFGPATYSRLLPNPSVKTFVRLAGL
ncbi:hypothetical protein PoB_000013700 [Plakobranchus ocellatus]|uniref:Apple domain-containing protein n=1 Tax=Plakobranchus ocellatus TaxID=259542 RepID=A0AAV3XTR6_9GAST|nr:hypothetical protein PoB_000013700 [Plakobranchus ocellatus]